MTEVDASIPLQAKGIQLDNPMDIQAKSLQLRNLGLQTQTAQQDFNDNQTLRALYQKHVNPDGTVDTGGLLKDVYGAGLAKPGMALQQQMLANRKTNADIDESIAKTSQANASADSTTLATTLTKVKQVAGTLYTLANTKYPDTQTAAAAVNQLVNTHEIPPDRGAEIMRNMPGDPTQIPSYFQRLANQGMTIGEQIETHLKTAPQLKDTGGALTPVDPLTGKPTGGPVVPKTATPGELLTASTADKRITALAEKGFSPDEGEMLGALAQHGVSLPSGLRSKDQMKATVRNLIDRNPGKSVDEIAEMVGNGQINFNSDKKAATVAAGQEGKVSTAVNELSTFGDQALAASAKVPRGSFIPANQLIQMADSSISDPNLLTLKLKLNALNNAYNVLSARGGTDAQSRDHVSKLFAAATGPEGVEALVKGLKEEGAGAKSAAADASHVGTKAPAAPTGAIVPIKSDADYNALPSGTVFQPPDGSPPRRKP